MSWLGFEKYAALEPALEVDPGARGVLRGVTTWCAERLRKAVALQVIPGEIPGAYWVYHPECPEEGEWVHLRDPQVDACHCADFLFRGEVLKTPCKHIVAALLSAQHPAALEAWERVQLRDRIEAALRAPVMPGE